MGQHGHHVVACDISLVGLELAKTKIDDLGLSSLVSLVNYSGPALPFRERGFETITLADVIEHVSYPQELLHSLSNLLKEGGTLLLSTPCRIDGKIWDPSHEREYSKGELEELVGGVFPKYRVVEQQPHAFYRIYNSRLAKVPLFRVVINGLALLGLNVFSIPVQFVPFSVGGQLYAVCKK
jgi:ubiquinone/menaquinone biosynthesis C-methylase UbiE